MLVYINKKKFIPKPKPKQELKEVFYSKPISKANKSKAESKTHKMPNGDIHTGAKHSKNSKLVRKAKLK
tara:strand:- start:395 stop:601 length:207 start_codon:yes stop_codon:yes gene_type:complete